MSTLFISDLHLDPLQPKITHTFFYFLEHIAVNADALYILGDFFEVMIGDDDDNPFMQSIIHALSRLTTSGVPVFFMHGNRDFLVGKLFEKRTGITLISDPSVINLYNQKILLMHGDSLCAADKSHQRFRKIVHNKIIQKIFLALPLSFRRKIANQMRKESTQYNAAKPAEIMDVTENAVNSAIKKYQVVKLIHGHTHKPQMSEQRIVLDAWHNHGNYLQFDREGKMELINVPH
ncbi:MAG: UDP-2,3-diacylglucosamine diphosphatase [Gammaproteobacteria bacterium]|nr:UDP-2,3-diacylglucosamine diphosphatase [Gammaproteobacteria bacterium]